MAILCQFNDDDSHTFKSLSEATKISESILKGQLALLCKAKVLLNEGDNYDLNLSRSSLETLLTGQTLKRRSCELI